MDAYYVDPARQTSAGGREPRHRAHRRHQPRRPARAPLAPGQPRQQRPLSRLDRHAARRSLLTPHEGPGQFFGALTPDGPPLYLGTNKTTDNLGAGPGQGRSGRRRVRHRGPRRARRRRARRRDHGRRRARQLALTWNVGRPLRAVASYDLAPGKERRLGQPARPRSSAEPTFAPDGRSLAVVASGAGAPADIWILDIASGSFRQLTRSPHAGHRPRHPRPARAGALRRPRRPASHRLAVSRQGAGRPRRRRHGLPRRPGGPVAARPSTAPTRRSSLRGISVLAPNVRGSSGFGKRFVNLDNGPLRANGVRDIKATIDHLVKSGIAAPGASGSWAAPTAATW